ncbi:hypothetical protein JM93_02840 [Roseibium hamelinense]|uniref:Uncharacterized protein n=1 Tax=Roseibium hamelinense TaxID=150831 RepID=A0A562SXW1_9HYPH|nr:hypothetical protein [Roseibium hamelinense]TWI86132.1 hypothetical protein JM93_02840 [Roseibium hamelinense]
MQIPKYYFDVPDTTMQARAIARRYWGKRIKSWAGSFSGGPDKQPNPLTMQGLDRS